MNLAENKTGITRDKLPVFEALIAERLFTAKFDPTNPVQDALVTRYGLKDNR